MNPHLEQALKKLDTVPPQTRVEVMRGFEIKRKMNGVPVGRIHYSADPDRDPSTLMGAAWFADTRKQYGDPADWEREYEIVDEAGGGQRVLTPALNQWGHLIIIKDPAWAPNPYWSVYAGFDHGGTNPTTLQKVYVDHDGNLYFCGEFYDYRRDGRELHTIAQSCREILGYRDPQTNLTYPGMPDLKKMKWISADPSLFYETEPTPEGAYTAAASIYAKHGLKLSKYEGERNDQTMIEKCLNEYWGRLDEPGRKPRVYIVCRNESDKRQPGLHPYDSPNLLWELRRIRRSELSGKQEETRNLSEKIVDKDNHAWDAFKYVCGRFPKAAEIPEQQRLQTMVQDLNPMSQAVALEKYFANQRRQQSSGGIIADMRSLKRRAPR